MHCSVLYCVVVCCCFFIFFIFPFFSFFNFPFFHLYRIGADSRRSTYPSVLSIDCEVEMEYDVFNFKIFLRVPLTAIISPSFSRTHTISPMHPCTHTRPHCPSLSLSLSQSHTHTLTLTLPPSLSFSLSLSH